jgi:hypothetical protein
MIVGRADHLPQFSACCTEAAAVLADGYAGAAAKTAIEKVRGRFESWYGVDFADRKLRRLRGRLQREVAATLRPLVERELYRQFGVVVEEVLAATVYETSAAALQSELCAEGAA